jgi:hypothetical protein
MLLGIGQHITDVMPTRLRVVFRLCPANDDPLGGFVAVIAGIADVTALVDHS